MYDKPLVASTLREIAALLSIAGENRFKILAFENAARAIEGIAEDLGQFVANGRLAETQGIGKAIGPIVEGLVRVGQSEYLDELRTQYPPGLLDLLKVPGLSAKKIGQLHSELGIDSLDLLEAACRAGLVARIKGFGGKNTEKIQKGIAFARRNQRRFLLPKGLDVVETLEPLLRADPSITAFSVTGQIRRRLEVISQVQFCIASERMPEVAATIGGVALLSEIELNEDGSLQGVWANGVPVSFVLCSPEEFAHRLVVTTGSEEFVAFLEENVADVTLTDSGFVRHKALLGAVDEGELFAELGLPWVEAELREPETKECWASPPHVLIEASDLSGIFHMHSTWSDGKNTLAEMLEAVKKRGYSYVGISDHSKSAGYAGGLSEDRVRQQRAEIRKLRTTMPGLTIFHGTEADILGDGAIDYDAELLYELDFVIASVHSRFNMNTDEMTERLVQALRNPWVTFLGHMTGRMLLTREGYTFDYDAIFDAAGQNGVMIEINGNPNRRDIDWRLLRRAMDRGVRFSIHPDAHSVSGLDNVLPGVWNARKAGLSPEDIFNTRSVAEVAEYLAARRTRAAEMTLAG